MTDLVIGLTLLAIGAGCAVLLAAAVIAVAVYGLVTLGAAAWRRRRARCTLCLRKVRVRDSLSHADACQLLADIEVAKVDVLLAELAGGPEPDALDVKWAEVEAAADRWREQAEAVRR
jgi:hypothetical protein